MDVPGEKADQKSWPRTKKESPASKSRKIMQKTIVKLKIEADGVKQRGEGPPSDFWSWRKYGQKPIKGSPHPRGYYRCSTSKGCSAKKQVERCRTDASVFIITYTSIHNHPGPNLPLSKGYSMQSLHLPPKNTQEPPSSPAPPRLAEEDNCLISDAQQPTDDVEDIADLKTGEDCIVEKSKKIEDNLNLTYNPATLSYQKIIKYGTSTKSEEENDFYDELEELPISSSSFTGMMRSSQLFEERFSSYSLLA